MNRRRSDVSTDVPSVQQGTAFQPLMTRKYTEDDRKCRRWKTWLAVFCCLAVTVAVLVIVLIFAIVPQVAQSSVNHSTMTLESVTIYNPTNDSISMLATIKLQNTGGIKATLKGKKTNVVHDHIQIGTMVLPDVDIKGVDPTSITINTSLLVTNLTHFQASVKKVLQGYDQVWYLNSHPDITAYMAGIKFHANIKLHKSITLPASQLQNLNAHNITVVYADNATMHAKSDIELVTETVATFELPPTIMDIYFNGEQIGYAPLNAVALRPGINYLNNTEIHVVKTPQNQQAINEFFSRYIEGMEQPLQMVGPRCAADGSSLVIDNVIDSTVQAAGNSKGDLAFAGSVTSQSQKGWPAYNPDTGDTSTVRGAYLDTLNIVNTPVRLSNLSVFANLHEPIRYDVKIAGLFTYECWENYTTKYGHVFTDYGIWQDNSSKTWVELPGNGRKTFFGIVYPQPGQEDPDESCFGIYPYSCCWATLTTAVICRDNPQLLDDIDSQVTTNYFSLDVSINATLAIANAFEIDVSVHQDFYPVYFGYEVYAGYLGDFELQCSDYTFY